MHHRRAVGDLGRQLQRGALRDDLVHDREGAEPHGRVQNRVSAAAGVSLRGVGRGAVAREQPLNLPNSGRPRPLQLPPEHLVRDVDVLAARARLGAVRAVAHAGVWVAPRSITPRAAGPGASGKNENMYL